MKYLLTFLLFIFLFACQLLSQNTIRGRIHDLDGNPIERAEVSTNNPNIVVVYSDAKGHFILNNTVNNKISNLKISHICFETAIVPIDNKDSLNIELIEKDNFLNTVVVTGTRTEKTLKDNPILTKVISSESLHNIGAVTMLDALEYLMPSIYFNQNAMGDNVQIQGLTNNYIVILIDGERVAPERRENVNFSRLNVAEIDHIEIINGPASVMYGSNAIGGVINIITKKVNKNIEGYIQGRLSKYTTIQADAGLGFKIKKLTSKTGFNFKTTDGYNLTSFTARPHEDFTINQKFTYEFSKKINAELLGSFYQHDIKKTTSTERTHRRDKNYTITGKINYLITSKNLLTVSAHSDIFDAYIVREDNSVYKDADFKYSTLRIMDIWTPSDKFQLTAGYEYNKESTYSIKLFGNEDEGGIEKISHNNNLFAQSTIKIIENLEGIAGLRFTNHSGFGTHWSPAFSLMYKLNHLRFRGSINNGFKAPSMKERHYNFFMGGQFYVYGNPDLKPESSWYESFSLEYIKSRFNISTTLFHNQISDKLDIEMRKQKDDPEQEDGYYVNLNKVQIKGIDVSIQWNFLNHFSFKGGYTFSDAINKETKTQLSGNSKHNITSTLSFKYSKFKIAQKDYPFTLTLGCRYFSPRIEEKGIINSDRTKDVRNYNSKAFSLWKFVYTQNLPLHNQWKAEIQVGIDNIFNYKENNVSTNSLLGAITPGRNFSIMGRITF